MKPLSRLSGGGGGTGQRYTDTVYVAPGVRGCGTWCSTDSGGWTPGGSRLLFGSGRVRLAVHLVDPRVQEAEPNA